MTATDWTDVEAAAKAAAGNHYHFTCFAWYNRPADGDKWTLVYTHNRDSGLLDQSNAAAIAQALELFTEADEPDVIPEHHSHWACGWIDGYALRVYRPDGTITDAFHKWCELQGQMDDYPLLDEEDHSQREYNAAIDAIKEQGRRLVKDNAPDDWPGQVFSWLWDHDQRELDNRDGTGAYPSEESVRAALQALDLLESED